MGTSVILGINELTQGQVQAYQTVNDMLKALEEVMNKATTVSLSSGDYTVPALDFVRYALFTFTSASADREITFPSLVGVNPSKRLVWVANSTDYVLTLTTDDPGTTVIVQPGRSVLIHVNAGDISILGQGTTPNFSVGIYAESNPPHQTIALQYVFTERVKFLVDFDGSAGAVITNPTVPVRFDVKKNDLHIGYVIIATDGTFSFVLDAASQFEVGDILRIDYLALQYGTIAFTSVADSGDTVTIDDGDNAPVVFTFGAGGGQVAPGVTPAASAQNLKTAIEAAALNVEVAIVASTLYITNLYEGGGGSITKSDADNDYTVTDFTTDSTANGISLTLVGSRTT